MATCQIRVEILHDPYDPARARPSAIRSDRHDVDLDRQVDRACQVAHEHERTLQDPDQQQRETLVVLRNLATDLLDPLFQLRTAYDRLFDPRVTGPLEIVFGRLILIRARAGTHAPTLANRTSEEFRRFRRIGCLPRRIRFLIRWVRSPIRWVLFGF